MCVYFCFRVCFFAFFDALRVDALRVEEFLRVDEVLRCFVEGQNFSRASFSL